MVTPPGVPGWTESGLQAIRARLWPTFTLDLAHRAAKPAQVGLRKRGGGMAQITLDMVKTVMRTEPHAVELVLERAFADIVAGQQNFILFDGGANTGWHTVRFLRRPGCAKLYAIEADPYIAQTWRENMEKWNVAALPPELELVQKALQNDPAVTSIPWKSSPTHPGRASIVSLATSDRTIHSGDASVKYRDVFEVPATTVDAILANETRRLPLLKLDLEGADFLAIRGAEAVMTRDRPIVAFENASIAPDVHGYTRDEMLGHFASLGYVMCNFTGHPVTKSDMFSFYEAWACPADQVDSLRILIEDAFHQTVAEIT